MTGPAPRLTMPLNQRKKKGVSFWRWNRPAMIASPFQKISTSSWTWGLPRPMTCRAGHDKFLVSVRQQTAQPQPAVHSAQRPVVVTHCRLDPQNRMHPARLETIRALLAVTGTYPLTLTGAVSLRQPSFFFGLCLVPASGSIEC